MFERSNPKALWLLHHFFVVPVSPYLSGIQGFLFLLVHTCIRRLVSSSHFFEFRGYFFIPKIPQAGDLGWRAQSTAHWHTGHATNRIMQNAEYQFDPNLSLLSTSSEFKEIKHESNSNCSSHRMFGSLFRVKLIR